MTQDWKDSARAQSRALFACGTVLGICLGFAAGHVSVWSRWSDSSRFDPSAEAAETHNWPTFSPLLTESQDRQPAPGMRGPFAPADTSQPYFLKALRRDKSPAPIDVTPEEESYPSRPVRVAAKSSTPTAEPNSLPEAAPADPIDEATQLREQVTRSIIAQEIPHATAQEQDVWFDVLRGLNPADVKGILRMRKHVGGDQTTVIGKPGPLPESVGLPAEVMQEPTAPVGASGWPRTLECLRSVRDIRLHNLCNAGTAGFQLFVPVLSEVIDEGDGAGVQLAKVRHVVTPGEFQETGRALDIAILGPGFLSVRWKGATRLTRDGRLMIDDERFLALAATKYPWRLDPPIAVPEDVASLTISPDGHVTARHINSDDESPLGTIPLLTVFDAAGLRFAGEGLFEATTASGRAHRLTDEASLRQYGLEHVREAVLRSEELTLEREEQLMRNIERAMGERE